MRQVDANANSNTASGHGSCWMAPPFVTPLKQWIEMLASMYFHKNPTT